MASAQEIAASKKGVIEMSTKQGAIGTSDSIDPEEIQAWIQDLEVPEGDEEIEDGTEVLMAAVKCVNPSRWWYSYSEEQGYVHRCDLDNFVQQEVDRECNPNNLGLEEFAKTGLPSSYADKPENKGRNQLSETSRRGIHVSCFGEI